MFSSLGSQIFLHVGAWASVTDHFHPISYFAQLWIEVPMSLLSLIVSIMLTAKYCVRCGRLHVPFFPRNVAKSPTLQTSSISRVVKWSPGVWSSLTPSIPVLGLLSQPCSKVMGKSETRMRLWFAVLWVVANLRELFSSAKNNLFRLLI